MRFQNTQTLNGLLKTTKQNCLESSSYLNLPDLQFFQWCNRQFGVNRGVYNTIETWLYQYGIVNIHNRRIQLLAFLEFVKDDEQNQNQYKFIRFGHGGLTRRLSEFINETGNSGKVLSQKK